MPISANTLFHFTRKFETLVKILESKFLPKLCLEDSIMPSAIPIRLAVPMVCFCDIPLSQVSEHTLKYGRYAIGIKKEWAMKQGVTPVLYVHENSLIPNTIISEMQNISISIQGQKNPDYSKMMRLIDVVCMMKRYHGYDSRLGKEIRYYDEREWRYIPKRESQDQFCYLLESFYNKESVRSAVNLANEKYGVVFNPDAINYLIVDKESEILKLQRIVREIKGIFPHDSVELLTTRILSLERIEQDM